MVEVDGSVRLVAADGYRMRTSGVSVNLKSQTMHGDEGVEGEIPAGTFSSQSVEGDLAARTIALEGNARLRMVPGKLRVP